MRLTLANDAASPTLKMRASSSTRRSTFTSQLFDEDADKNHRIFQWKMLYLNRAEVDQNKRRPKSAHIP